LPIKLLGLTVGAPLLEMEWNGMIDEWIIIVERSTKASNFSMLSVEWLPTLSGLMLGWLCGGVYGSASKQ